jgi:hypothetical protein
MVGLGSPLEHGVDVADVDDGLERRRAAAGEGERLAALLGGRRRLVPLPDQRPAQAFSLLLLPSSRHRGAARSGDVERRVIARAFAAREERRKETTGWE